MTAREFRLALWLMLTCLVAASCVHDASAQDLPNLKINPDGSATYGRNGRFGAGYFNPIDAGSNVPLRGQVYATGVTANANGPIINGSHGVVYKNPAGQVTNIPVNQSVQIPKSSLAKAGRLALKALPWVALAAELPVILAELNNDDIHDQEAYPQIYKNEIQEVVPTQLYKTTSNQLVGTPVLSGSFPPVGTSVQSMSQLEGYLQAMAPQGQNCKSGSNSHKWQATYVANDGTKDYRVSRLCLSPPYNDAGEVRIYFDTKLICPEGSTPTGTKNCTKVTKRPATDQEIEAALAEPITLQNQTDMLDQITEAGQTVDIPSSAPSTTSVPTPEVTGQPRSSSTTTYDAEGNPTVTTKTSTDHVTVTSAGTTINNSTATTTVNTVTNTYVNNTLVSTETTNQPQPDYYVPPAPEPEEDEEPEDDSFTDSTFPPVPELYEQKYPDGLVGVWEAKKGAILSSQFITQATDMFDGVGGSGGSCPSWILNLNFGSKLGNFGQGDISPPCWIWPAMGLIFLTTACFTAWRMIFGG